MNYDELRRAAERTLGKDTVDHIERQLANQADRPREIMGASDIDFRPQPREREREETEVSAPPTPKKRKRKPAAHPPDPTVAPAVQSQPVHALVAPPSASQTQIPPPRQPEERTLPSASERLLAQAIAGEYRYGMLGISLGMAAIVGGIILGLNGVVGATSWTAKFLGLDSQINDAAPGVVLFVVGLFFVLITKPKVRLERLRG